MMARSWREVRDDAVQRGLLRRGEIPGTIEGVTGYTIEELRDVWEDMRADPKDWELGAKRLACMAVGLANQLRTRPTKPGRQFPGVGVAALVIRDDQLLMLQRTGAHGAGTWSVPGGWLEWGEDWHAAIEREVLEETGVVVDAVGSASVTEDLFTADGIHAITLFGSAVHLSGEPQIMEAEKALAVEWVPLEEVEQRELFLPLRTYIEKTRRHTDP